VHLRIELNATRASQQNRVSQSNHTKVLGNTLVSVVDVTNDFEPNEWTKTMKELLVASLRAPVKARSSYKSFQRLKASLFGPFPLLPLA
jgi:hypothetical protein